jgi:5-methyltetrahydrofolate--homocysteine methyltransferase
MGSEAGTGQKRVVPILASVTFIQGEQSRRHRADGRGVLEFDLARAAAERGHELRAGPKEMRPLIEELSGARADLRQRVSERRPAESAAAHRFSRNAGIARAAIARMGAERLAEHRGRLLRHHAAAHQGDSRGRARHLPPRVVPTVEPYLRLSGLDALTLTAADQFPEHRRAHECRRFARNLPTHQGGRLRGRARHRPPAGRERRAGH